MHTNIMIDNIIGLAMVIVTIAATIAICVDAALDTLADARKEARRCRYNELCSRRSRYIDIVDANTGNIIRIDAEHASDELVSKLAK